MSKTIKKNINCRACQRFQTSKTTAGIPGLDPTSEENGNLDDVFKAGSFHDFLVKLHGQFGSIASFWWGKQYAISIATAELFEEQQHLFERALEPFTKLAPFVEAKSMCFANDEAGEKRVQSIREALTKEALNKYYPPIQEVIDEIVEEWSKGAGEERIPLTQCTSRFASKATCHALFGKVLKNHSKAGFDFWRETEEVWADIEITFMKPKTKETERHLQEDEMDLRKLMKQLLDDRKSSPPPQGEENLLEWIISHSGDDESQLADVMQFTISGQYTTGYFLTAAIYYIATHSDVGMKLYDEIKNVLGDTDVNGTNISDLVYLRQVLDETLRCSLVATWAARCEEVDSKLGGYDIPKNTYAFQALGVVLQDEDVWPHPSVFDPDRFSKQNSEERSNLSFCPFGVGKRECIARDFAYAEATVALVTILRKFKVQLVDSEQVLTPVRGLVSHAKEEIYIKLLSR